MKGHKKMDMKYELLAGQSIQRGNRTLFRVRALVSFGSVSAGECGGYIEFANNLDQSGNAWVYGNAQVSGNAWVYGNAAIIWASHVGSENGTLSAFCARPGILVTRGCFIGTPEEFLAAVASKHGGTQIETEYRLLIEFMQLRLSTAVLTLERRDGS